MMIAIRFAFLPIGAFFIHFAFVYWNFPVYAIASTNTWVHFMFWISVVGAIWAVLGFFIPGLIFLPLGLVVGTLIRPAILTHDIPDVLTFLGQIVVAGVFIWVAILTHGTFK